MNKRQRKKKEKPIQDWLDACAVVIFDEVSKTPDALWDLPQLKFKLKLRPGNVCILNDRRRI